MALETLQWVTGIGQFEVLQRRSNREKRGVEGFEKL